MSGPLLDEPLDLSATDYTLVIPYAHHREVLRRGHAGSRGRRVLKFMGARRSSHFRLRER